ncbi:transmembrane and death domain protein 1 [Prinia subflava]|uniref:transmembrane and death domain protein 1 n=1 Tax=Prinia subflava TaxID=208062 RepID=UPI002FE136C8
MAHLAHLALALLLLLPARARCDDSVAAAVGPHAMGRIAELLAGSECHQLRAELESPEEQLEIPGEEPGSPGEKRSIPREKRSFPELREPLPEEERGIPGEEPGIPERSIPGEKEPLPEEKRPSRRRRSAQGCSATLRLWLLTAGSATTWDRLVRALRRVGRADIARELGKNLNQDRSLQLRRNVEGYRRSVQHLSSAQLQPRGRRAPGARGMRFERRRPPRYRRGLLGWARPLALGVLGAFLSSALLAGTAMYFCHWRRLLGA